MHFSNCTERPTNNATYIFGLVAGPVAPAGALLVLPQRPPPVLPPPPLPLALQIPAAVARTFLFEGVLSTLAAGVAVGGAERAAWS